MRKMLHVLGLFMLCAIASQSLAQQRFMTEVFTDVTVESNVKYGENYSVLTGAPVLQDLVMDVYTPTGDTAPMRPLIIMTHAGSFLPKGLNQLPFGNKNDSSIVEMCMQFAKRGWVAVAMNYRLGWNPISPSQEVKANTIINAVYRAMQDAKTCVRYFKKDAATADMYKVDTMKITVGGSNSGGYVALAYGSLDKTSEINIFKLQDGSGNPFVNQAITGGFDGEGGMTGVNVYNHPGHTSDVQLILSMGGAIGDTIWQEAGEVPIIAFHGVADFLTPYHTATVIVASTGDPIIEVSGSHDFSRYANTLGNQDVFVNASFSDAYTLRAKQITSFEGLFPFEGPANGFEPWAWYNPNDPNIDTITPGATGYGSKLNPYASKAKALTYMDSIMGYFCPRAVVALGITFTGIEDEVDKTNLSVYPNPSYSGMTISNSLKQDKIKTIELYNTTGQVVRKVSDLSVSEFFLERNNLPAGLYLLQVSYDKYVLSNKVIFK